jgi:phosphatidylserine decarboxylase
MIGDIIGYHIIGQKSNLWVKGTDYSVEEFSKIILKTDSGLRGIFH